MHEWSTENLLHRAREIALWEAEAVYSVAGQVSESLIPILEALIQCQGHVLVTGVGTSRFVAERMAHLLSSCGTPAMYVSAPDCLHGGIGTVTAQNVVLIISKGGQSVEINQFAGLAKARGAKIIAMTETFHSPLAEIADFIYKIIVPRDVDPFGMVAMEPRRYTAWQEMCSAGYSWKSKGIPMKISKPHTPVERWGRRYGM